MTSSHRAAYYDSKLIELDCRRCGYRVWGGELSESAAATLHKQPGWRVLLNAGMDPRGSADVVGGRIVLSHEGSGNYFLHRCPATILGCKYCGGAIRIMINADPLAEALVVVDAEPAADGLVVVNQAGQAVVDRARVMAGDRFRWHQKH